MQVPLNSTLRRHIASKLVRYEYSTMEFRNSTGGARMAADTGDVRTEALGGYLVSMPSVAR